MDNNKIKEEYIEKLTATHLKKKILDDVLNIKENDEDDFKLVDPYLVARIQNTIRNYEEEIKRYEALLKQTTNSVIEFHKIINKIKRNIDSEIAI